MALIKCPECGKEVSDQAASCPNCRHPLRRKENAQPQMQQNNNQPNVRYVSQPVKKKGHGCLITIIIIVVFFAIVVAIIGGTSGKTGSNDDIDAESIKSVEETAEQTEIPFGQEGSLGNLSMTVNEVAEAERLAGIAEDRKSQVGTGDRSERIRTYNYPQGRVTDHRIGLTLYKLDSFMNGDIEEVINALITADQAEKMKAMGNTDSM